MSLLCMYNIYMYFFLSFPAKVQLDVIFTHFNIDNLYHEQNQCYTAIWKSNCYFHETVIEIGCAGLSPQFCLYFVIVTYWNVIFSSLIFIKLFINIYLYLYFYLVVLIIIYFFI